MPALRQVMKKNKGEVSVGNIVEKSYRYKIFLINHIHMGHLHVKTLKRKKALAALEEKSLD